jgi:hypothetical protein
MYEAMDLLHAHAETVEKAVFFQTADLFNLEVDLIFYDTTTASFSVDYEDDPDRHTNATLRKYRAVGLATLQALSAHDQIRSGAHRPRGHPRSG